MRPSTIVSIIVIVIILIAGFVYFSANPLGGSATTGTTTSQTQARVLFPAGGETLTAGKTYTLLWSPGASSNMMQIFLVNTALESQGESVAISQRQYNVPDVGSFAFTIATSTPSGTYKFEIGPLTSNEFRIASTTGQ